MPLLVLLQFLVGVLSLAILGGSGFLLWEWREGDLLVGPAGELVRVREDWMLWTGLALLAWSFLGRIVVVPLITTRDRERRPAPAAASMTVASPTGSQLYVEVSGPAGAPAVILTHGWSLDRTVWRGIAARLAGRYRVLAWDLPGLGKSKLGADKTITLPRLAADLRAVMETTEGPAAAVVGHSIGGMSIQTLARDDAAALDRAARGVALVNTTYTNPLRTMALGGVARALRWPVLEPMLRLCIWLQPLVWLSAWQSYLSGSAHIANRFGFGRRAPRRALEHVTLLMTKAPPAVSARGNLAMMRWDAEGAMARAQSRLLVIGGAADIVTKPQASAHIAAHAHRDPHIVSAVNHMGFLEDEDAYVELIEAFLAATADAVSVAPSRA